MRALAKSAHGLSRRAWLRWTLGGIASTGAGVAYWRSLRHGTNEAQPITVTATPLASFNRTLPRQTRFGALTYRSGVALASTAGGFGGLSGLWRDPTGRRLVAVSDHAQWLSAEIDYMAGRLAGLSRTELSPILGEDGVPLRQGRAYDCEALAIADGVAYVGIERAHEVRRFAWAEQGPQARGVPIPLPAEIARQPRNRGIEALAIAPPGHPLAGALLAIAEAPRSGDDDPTPGWIVTGPDRFALRVARSRDFNVTDALFLPGGDLLLLERSFSPLRGVACRIRRVAGSTIGPGAMLDGPFLMEADGGHEIDNMEGLSLHRDPTTGEAVLTLVSDDNFLPMQRTLLLEFTLPE